MNVRILKSLAALLLAACCASAGAEDIDLFVGAPGGSNEVPNVLFVVDNTANWTPAFTNEMAALANTFDNLPVNADGSAKFNVGVMLSAETGSGDSNVSGGYVRAAIRPMTSSTKAKYAAMISAFDVIRDKGNGGASSLWMAEAYRYLSGGAAHAGNNKAKADFLDNTGVYWSSSATTPQSLAAMRAIYALPGNALASYSAGTYNSPVTTGCTKNYIIYISNGPSQDNSSVITQATSMLSAAGGSTTQIPLSPSGSQTNVSDEWARFMKQSSLGVVTYTIDVNPANTGQGPGWSEVLQSMATVSNGKYTAVSSASGSTQISDAVNKALSEIQAVNGVFASVSLPVSVNTQGTYLNQLYVGMFRPDHDAYPRWAGNLKQYRLGITSGELRLQDADAHGAINNLTGFITECARSFWTPTTNDTYWAFRPQGGCIPPDGFAQDAYLISNFPDGNIVEKGAQGYKLRGTTARIVKTCSSAFASCTALTNFTTANSAITAAALGPTVTATERDALINWARGLNIDDEKNDGITNVMRPSAHGDVVHSRPLAVNFGTDTAPKVVVFYGGNDGVLRAVNGNRSEDIGTVGPGSELWAFLPPEFYPHIKRLRDNTTQISYPNVTSGSPLPKPYGMDGAVTAHRDSNGAWVYATMRRGGRAVYAFNVDANDPANITLKWKKGCPNNFPATGTVSDTDCTSGFSAIGQTWSAPKVLKASGYGSAPLLIFGGGYDICEDADPNTCTSPKGNRIYVLDADTGALLKTFTTERSVIADITVVPNAATGFARHAYAADLGGNVYRVNIGTAAPDSWTMTRIASLGCATPASCAGNRKFMFAPDVVERSGQYLLLLGSGDREKPLLYGAPASVTNGVANHFFMLKDVPGDSTWLSSESTNCGIAVLCMSSLVGITTSANPSQSDLDARKGWYLALNATEQVVTSAITIFGTVTFSTHQPEVPQPGSCTTHLGTARVYNISYRNAAPTGGRPDRSEQLPPVGLPPSPVAGLVTLDDGQTVPFCIGCSPDSPLEGIQPEMPTTGVPIQPKARVYWYVQK